MVSLSQAIIRYDYGHVVVIHIENRLQFQP